MEDCLSPSLVNKERPKWFSDPSSKWRSLTYPQHLQLGAVQLSILRTKSTHNWTISNLKTEDKKTPTPISNEKRQKNTCICTLELFLHSFLYRYVPLLPSNYFVGGFLVGIFLLFACFVFNFISTCQAMWSVLRQFFLTQLLLLFVFFYILFIFSLSLLSWQGKECSRMLMEWRLDQYTWREIEMGRKNSD